MVDETTETADARDLQPGDIIKRTPLHERFGGSRQGGIGPSTTTPNVFVFTDPSAGRTHGYHDRGDGPLFLYVDEGQRGNQRVRAGNKAVLDHAEEGRALTNSPR